MSSLNFVIKITTEICSNGIVRTIGKASGLPMDNFAKKFIRLMKFAFVGEQITFLWVRNKIVQYESCFDRALARFQSVQ